MNTLTKGEHSNDVQPSEGAYFHQIASSTKEIKTNRSQLAISCSGCTKMGTADSDIALLKCSRVSPFFRFWKVVLKGKPLSSAKLRGTVQRR